MVLLLGQLTAAICRSLTLCLLQLLLLLAELFLVRCVGLARKQPVKFATIFADSVRQHLQHSRSARLGPSFKYPDSFFGARD